LTLPVLPRTFESLKMFVKFFSRPTKRDGSKGGSPKLSMNYLLNKPEGKVRVLAGNPELAVELAENLVFENKYTVGCLTFEEANIPEKHKYEIIQKFEDSFFAGLDADQYHISWIEHTDKGRLELNFFIPNVELSTGKRLQPYFFYADKHLSEGLKQVVNLQYGLTSPDDPQKRQTVMLSKNLPKSSKDAVEAINGLVTDGFTNGDICNRKELIQFLENAGFEIARQAEKYISIKNDNGRNIRLKGAFYEQSFDYSGERKETDRASEARKTTELLLRAEAAFAQSIEKRRAEFSKKFKKEKTGSESCFNGVTGAGRELTQGISQEIQNPVLGTSMASGVDGSRERLYRVGGKEPISPGGALEAIGGDIQGGEQRDIRGELHNARPDKTIMREDRPELSRPRMDGKYENISEVENLDGPSYEALKGRIARFRREAEQRVEALKREIKQAAERYREIAGGKPGIKELARGIISKFRVKIQKQAQSKKEINQSREVKF